MPWSTTGARIVVAEAARHAPRTDHASGDRLPIANTRTRARRDETARRSMCARRRRRDVPRAKLACHYRQVALTVMEPYR